MNSLSCSKCTFINISCKDICEMCGNDFIKEKEQIIENNYIKAYQVIPESFFKVDMLYFNCSINGYNIKAFVDTGAQMTIMNYGLAKKIGIDHLIDKKYKGKAIGVGEQNIIGKIHLQEIEILEKGISIPCSFSILGKMDIDIIFGLDMLLSHGIILDLKNKCMKLADININFIKN